MVMMGPRVASSRADPDEVADACRVECLDGDARGSADDGPVQVEHGTMAGTHEPPGVVCRLTSLVCADTAHRHETAVCRLGHGQTMSTEVHSDGAADDAERREGRKRDRAPAGGARVGMLCAGSNPSVSTLPLPVPCPESSPAGLMLSRWHPAATPSTTSAPSRRTTRRDGPSLTTAACVRAGLLSAGRVPAALRPPSFA